MGKLLIAGALLCAASTSFAYVEDCHFQMGGQPYLHAQIAVTGPEQFGNSLNLIDINGNAAQSISAKQVKTQNASEQERFALDVGGNSAFDALVFYVPQDDATSIQAKIFFKANAVTPSLSGSCTYQAE